MSTTAVWNGFGKYETKDGEKGITLKYSGKEFFFPFEKITYLPDFTMREVDHAKSTAEGEEEGSLTYMTFRVSGQRLAEELLAIENPVSNAQRGIVLVPPTESKKTGEFLQVFSGVSEEGQALYTEVAEVEPLPHIAVEAAAKALEYKKQLIQEYFQSKRERMAGAPGQLFPRGLVRVFMDELGVQDIDDVAAKMNNGNMNAAMAQFLQMIMAGSQQASMAAVTQPNPVPPVATVPPPVATTRKQQPAPLTVKDLV